eukprot:scpid80949/ scgid28267/ 
MSTIGLLLRTGAIILLGSVVVASDISQCGNQIASYPCHSDQVTCHEERLGKIANTLPLGRGVDAARASDLYSTRKPHVFDLSYCDNNRSEVGRFFNGYRVACEADYDDYAPREFFRKSVKVYTSAKQYGSDKAMTAGLSATESNFALQGSYDSVAADIREQRGAVAELERTVQIGSVRLEGLECLRFTENYKRCFNQLNETDPTHPAYHTIFTEFGTHVVVRVGIGATQKITSTINQCTLQSLQKDRFGVKLGLEKFISIALGSTSASSEFESLGTSEVSFKFIGGDASLYRTDQWQQYVASVNGSEAVIAFEMLVPLYSLVDNINTIDDPRDQVTFGQTYKTATLLHMENAVVQDPPPVDCNQI